MIISRIKKLKTSKKPRSWTGNKLVSAGGKG